MFTTQTCHVLHVTCRVSRVTCHVSLVTCHISCVTCLLCFLFFFFGQSGESCRCRVSYQRGLPRLVVEQPRLHRVCYAKLWLVRPLIKQIHGVSPQYLSNVSFRTSRTFQMRWKKERKKNCVAPLFTPLEVQFSTKKNVFPFILIWWVSRLRGLPRLVYIHKGRVQKNKLKC